MICDLDLTTKSVHMDIRFVVTDPYNEQAIMDMVKEAFNIKQPYQLLHSNPIANRYMMDRFISENIPQFIIQNTLIYDMGKTYVQAINGWGKEYRIMSARKYEFIHGYNFLQVLVKDGKIALISDLKMYVDDNIKTVLQDYKLPIIKLFDDVKPYLVTDIGRFGRCTVIHV
jgi:hypothetical protein